MFAMISPASEVRFIKAAIFSAHTDQLELRRNNEHLAICRVSQEGYQPRYRQRRSECDNYSSIERRGMLQDKGKAQTKVV